MSSGGTTVSVLDVMRLQVLGNDPLALQCAKLKVREVSGGRNRPGAGLVSRAHTFHRRPPEAPCSLSLPLSLSLNHFAKNLPLFLRRFQLLMFVNKVCRVFLFQAEFEIVLQSIFHVALKTLQIVNSCDRVSSSLRC